MLALLFDINLVWLSGVLPTKHTYGRFARSNGSSRARLADPKSFAIRKPGGHLYVFLLCGIFERNDSIAEVNFEYFIVCYLALLFICYG